MPRLHHRVNNFNKVNAFIDAAGEEDFSGEMSLTDQTISDAKDLKQEIDFISCLRNPQYELKDVILPKTTESQVNLVTAELKNYNLIYESWGMASKHKHDRAICINMVGAPGTGKTMTAEAIAHALGCKILIVPYAQVESKYVGETPKNIEKVFDFARDTQCALFFDEADSFMGKRLENVTQSADTAVNLTRSVMLTRLSSHEGVVIFATNLIGNYDPAFLSRIRWQIQFDLPDVEAREKIWQAQIPSQLPVDDSVDYLQLATKFDGVSGRDIKMAVLQAVVSAASEEKIDSDKRVCQSHFMKAIANVIAAKRAFNKPSAILKPINGDIDLPAIQDQS